MLVLYDDATREYLYGAQGLPDTRFGNFTAALYEEAKKDGWTVVSMKNDWNRIFHSGSTVTDATGIPRRRSEEIGRPISGGHMNSGAGRVTAIPALRRHRGPAGRRSLHDRRLPGLPRQGGQGLRLILNGNAFRIVGIWCCYVPSSPVMTA